MRYVFQLGGGHRVAYSGETEVEARAYAERQHIGNTVSKGLLACERCFGYGHYSYDPCPDRTCMLYGVPDVVVDPCDHCHGTGARP